MKKWILCSLLLLAFAGIQAQTTIVIEKPYDWAAHRHSVSLSVGLPTLYSTASGNHSWGFYFPAPGTTVSSSDRSAPSEIFCGSWAIDYGYNALRWLRVGGTANYECWAGTRTTHDACLMAKVDFTYINRRHIILFSGVGAGVGVHVERQADGGLRGWYLPAVDLTPIGLHAGNEHVYGLVETHIGASSFFRVGIGFRP